MQRIFTLLISGKSLNPAAGYLFGVSTLSVLSLFASVWGVRGIDDTVESGSSATFQSEMTVVEIVDISTTDQIVCGSNDGTMTIHFSDTYTAPSTYRIELARTGKPAMVHGGYTGSPIVLPKMFPGTFSIRVVRETDEVASPYFDKIVNTACNGLGFRDPEEACGQPEDLVLYENCEGFKVFIPENLFEANTFIFVDDDHIGCVAFVNEDCEIQPSTRVYCADFELEVPFWEYTFFDNDPLDGIPTVISLKSYTKEDIALTGLQAARINYAMCNREGYTDGEVNDAIWGLLGQLEDFPVNCNALCQSAKDAVAEGVDGSEALEVIVTYKSPSPDFQDFVEQTTECIDCFPQVLTGRVRVNDGAFVDTCDVNVCTGESVTFDPQPENLSGWSWTGPNDFTSTDRQVVISNVSAQDTGVYTVTYAENDTCMGSKIFTLGLVAPPVAVASSSNPTCEEINGSVTFTFEDNPDRTALQFSLDGGATYQDPVNDNTGSVIYDGLAPGTYDLMARWAEGDCPVSLGTTTLTNLPSPTVDAGVDQLVCASSTVKLEAVATGGNGNITYIWSIGNDIIQDGPNGTLEVTPTESTTYTVSVVDEQGCFAMDMVTVTIPDAVVPTVTVEDVLCAGEATGSATVSATGGSGTYTYLWSNGSTTATISDLVAGEYMVTITDAEGCTAASVAVVAEPSDAVILDIVSTDGLLCNGDSTASVTVAASGGTPGYTISWSNGASGETVTGLPAGTFGVTVTDANGCTAENSVTVMEPAPITVDFATVGVACSGGNTGSATATISGGLPDYTVMWSTGATDLTITDLEAGSYGLTVTDANGCQVEATAVIEATTDGLKVNVNMVVDVTCKGDSTGSATLSATGGVEPYTFSSVDGLTISDGVISNLAAGSYMVMVSDANGCTATNTVVIGEPSDPVIVNITGSEDPLCSGEATGSATAEAIGGTAPYTYVWDNQATTAGISELAAGEYNVTATDANGCTATARVTINQPDSLGLTVASKVNIVCGGEANGSVALEPVGGSGPYVYSWTDGFDGASRMNLAAGEYTVSVTDGNNCTAEVSFTIEATEGLQLDLEATDVSCNGESDGSAIVTPSGGVAPFTYDWSNGSAIDTAANLAAGTYQVTVTDNEGCSATAEVTIAEPDQVSITVDQLINVDCKGASTGSVTIAVTGGMEPYSFLWSNNDITETADSLIAATYEVTVIDANGCSATASITVEEPLIGAAVEIESTAEALCGGAAAGGLKAMASGGSEPYQYAWSTGATTDSIGVTESGTYSVTVTDASGGCTAESSITIDDLPGLELSSTQVNVSCKGGFDGSIDVSVNGGVEPYTYDWSFGADVQDIDGIMAGSYSVTVTDANGCTDSLMVDIEDGEEFVLSFASLNVGCRGGSDGSIDLTVEGTGGNYIYTWSNGATTEDLEGLVKGTYSVTVTDGNGDCAVEGSVEITEAESNMMGFVNTMLMENCQREVVGMARASAIGGTPPYSYEWSTGETSQIANNLTAENYKVTITDANGCSIVEHLCLEIEQEVKWGGTIGYSQVLCGTSTPGAISSLALPSIEGVDEGDYLYSWQKSTTPCTEDVRIYGMDWEKISGANAASYDPGSLSESTYFIRYARAKGSSDFVESNVVFIEVINELEVNAGYDVFSCEGEPVDLEAVVSGGGTVRYEFDWDHGLGGGASHTVYPEETTVYSVTVTNDYGCSAVDQVRVITRPGPIVSAEVEAIPGHDNTYCMNEVVTIMADVGQGAQTASWTTSGDGTFSSGFGLSTEYTIGEKDAAAGMVVITATTANVIGTCPAKSYDIELVTNAVGSQACADRNFLSEPQGSELEAETPIRETDNETKRPLLADGNGIEAEHIAATAQITVYPNKPNPFSNETNISFSLVQDAEVVFTVFDMNGQVVNTRRGAFAKGYNEITFAKNNLPSGILYYALEVDGHRYIRKMVITE